MSAPGLAVQAGLYAVVGEELIGWSLWPWDRLYSPVVGVFADGALAETMACDLDRPTSMPPVSMRLRSRVRRRLTRVKITPVAVEVDGPDDRCWFRITPPAELLARLAADDRAVRVERLEDGALLGREGGPDPGDAPEPGTRRTVEDLLVEPAPETRTVLDGFPRFLTAPHVHQLELAFVEYLRRLPDPEARAGYAPQLERGDITVLDLRRMILDSPEFRARRVGLGAGLGGSFVSPLWRELAGAETIGRAHRPLGAFRVADLEGASTAAFVSAVYETMLGRSADPAGLSHYSHVADLNGRREVAVHLSRWAAARGVFIEVV